MTEFYELAAAEPLKKLDMRDEAIALSVCLGLIILGAIFVAWWKSQ